MPKPPAPMSAHPASGSAGGASATADDGPGILYFDPNPTTARIAAAGLRLAGYTVFHAAKEADAVALARARGPGGDGAIHCLILDASTAPEVSASVLRALVQLSGAAELPGILLVSRANPNPIPGAESLPSLKRPFTTPALVGLLREAIEPKPDTQPAVGQAVSAPVMRRLRVVVEEHFPELELDDERIAGFGSALVTESHLPGSFLGIGVLGHLSSVRLEAVLAMLASSGARGVLQLEDGPTVVRLHLDRGRIRLAEAEGVEEDLRLGRFVVEAGFMDNEALEAIAKTPDPSRRPLGQRLVEDGQLQRGELARVLLDQAREVTCHILEWTEGRFNFSPADHLHPLAAAASSSRSELKMAEALLQGLRRIEERAEMGPDMPAVDDVFLRDDERVSKMGRTGFSREELGVLELLNGRHTVKEIARKTRAGAFAVTKVAYRLAKAGLIHRRTLPVVGGG